VTVEFDYKQLERERKQNESQRDVMTVCYTHFGRVSGQYIDIYMSKGYFIIV
jgi:hypothetical protein